MLALAYYFYGRAGKTNTYRGATRHPTPKAARPQ